MTAQRLKKIVTGLMANHKGILAMDESNKTCNLRFSEFGIPQTEELRREYREMILTTPNLNHFINGVILCDETIRELGDDGELFTKTLKDIGVVAGIKVDTGAMPLAGHPGEKVTEGLDGLRDRLKAYSELGAQFAKWRAVIAIGAQIPTHGCIEANAHALARYAALCQEAGIVPVVEMEVLMDGDHSLEVCQAVTESSLSVLFDQLFVQGIRLDEMILKPNMVVPGLSARVQNTIEETADATIECLLKNVPPSVGGVAFLSGGQSGVLASERLNFMNAKFRARLPWPLTFSFARAIQQPAIGIWHGNRAQNHVAQNAIYHRAMCDRAAAKGEYSSAMEKQNL